LADEVGSFIKDKLYVIANIGVVGQIIGIIPNSPQLMDPICEVSPTLGPDRAYDLRMRTRAS
jgi:hypothetical protein